MVMCTPNPGSNVTKRTVRDAEVLVFCTTTGTAIDRTGDADNDAEGDATTDEEASGDVTLAESPGCGAELTARLGVGEAVDADAAPEDFTVGSLPTVVGLFSALAMKYAPEPSTAAPSTRGTTRRTRRARSSERCMLETIRSSDGSFGAYASARL
jgi:hypothetical protein